jgi:hypothetical protein
VKMPRPRELTRRLLVIPMAGTLAGPRRGDWASALKAGRRLVLSILAATLGVFACTAAPALAAAPKNFTTTIPPETPTGLTANPIAATTATLRAVLNPKAPGDAGSYEFLYGQPAIFEEYNNDSCYKFEQIEHTPTTHELGHATEAASAEVTGLMPATKYAFCLRVSNEAGELVESAIETFTTSPAPPSIEGESFSDLGSTEAQLEAEINPGGAETTYHFEYGPAAGSYDVSVPVAGRAIPGALTGRSVNAVATGLSPATTYHYRVVASNAVSGDVYGPDRTFTTTVSQGTGSPPSCPNEQLRAEQPYGLGLPDCRAYEMVSPVQTNGQDAVDPFTGGGPAAVSGEAVTYASRGSFDGPEGAVYENQFLSRRGPEGWSTRSITPPDASYESSEETPYGSVYFTPELSEGLATTDVPQSSEAPAKMNAFELYLVNFATGSYQLITNEGPGSQLEIMGASSDLSHVVYDSPSGESLYEWTGGKRQLVSVANNGESLDAHAGTASLYRNGSYNTYADYWHAVSSDGSRVFFTTPAHESGYSERKLYVRENAEQPQSPLTVGGECTVSTDACTVEVSASQRAVKDPAGPQEARYWGASADGSRVFFTSKAELTEDAYTGPADNAANLYEYDLENGKLKDLTGEETDDSGGGAAVQGVVQISGDGSYVYFVADGDLAGNAVAGEPNLYLVHGGETKFIATLSTNDGRDWGSGLGFLVPEEGGPGTNTARVTSDGTRLAFMSYSGLTGYDNLDSNTGEADNEIYLYDAETNKLVCASCNSSGARPVGSSSLKTFSGDSVLFFDSEDALVPHASDGRQNVYEFQDGHVYPISDVAGGYESFFIAAGANGDNVFFGTADQLLPQDQSNNVVVYDARVDGGFPVTSAVPACTNADSCKPPESPQPPIFGAPSSATFSGPGNIAPVVAVKPAVKPKVKIVKCVKGHIKRNGRCVKKIKSKKKARKSTSDKGSK